MEGSRFDRIAKLLAAQPSRRSFLKGIGKAALATVGVGGPIASVLWSRSGNAASCRDGGATCTSDSQCCSGECGEADSRGRRRCACDASDFPCGTTCCSQGDVCLNGTCTRPTATPTATPTIAPNVCTIQTCDCGNHCASFSDGTYECGNVHQAFCEGCQTNADCPAERPLCAVAFANSSEVTLFSEVCAPDAVTSCIAFTPCSEFTSTPTGTPTSTPTSTPSNTPTSTPDAEPTAYPNLCTTSTCPGLTCRVCYSTAEGAVGCLSSFNNNCLNTCVSTDDCAPGQLCIVGMANFEQVFDIDDLCPTMPGAIGVCTNLTSNCG